MDLRISDHERSRYTEIYGVDPLAREGWLTLRMKRELLVLGCDVAGDFDLLAASDEQVLETPATRGGWSVVVQVEKKRDKDASVFSVLIRS